MTTPLRRLYAVYLARRINTALATRSALTFNAYSFGLFGDARRGHIRAIDRLLKLQSRIDRRLRPSHARVVVSKSGSRLTVYATRATQETLERSQSHGTRA